MLWSDDYKRKILEIIQKKYQFYNNFEFIVDMFEKIYDKSYEEALESKLSERDYDNLLYRIGMIREIFEEDEDEEDEDANIPF